MDERYNALFRYSFSKIKTKTDESIIHDLYNEKGFDEILEYVKKRKFVPFVANTFVELGYIDEWKEIRDSYSNRNLKVIRALDELFVNLEKHGATHVVVVENFGSFLFSGAIPSWRFGSGDVDLYGDIEQKEKIYSAVRSLGYSIKERFSGSNFISITIGRDNTQLENFHFGIGWYPTARLKIPMLNYKEEVVNWDKVQRYHDTSIQIPEAEALLYICMMHISVHDFSRQPDIRLYIDIENICDNAIIDWEKIVSWATRDGFRNRISTVAYLTNELIGTKIPDRVVNLCISKNHEKLINHVYDKNKNALITDGGALFSFKTEVYANDTNALKGANELIFPSSKWLKQTFNSDGILAHFKYWKSLMC